jgi:hypothetical protein
LSEIIRGHHRDGEESSARIEITTFHEREKTMIMDSMAQDLRSFTPTEGFYNKREQKSPKRNIAVTIHPLRSTPASECQVKPDMT